MGKLLVILLAAVSLRATTIISEGFDDITTLPGSGWVQTNNSSPLGTTNWFQGNSVVFTSHSGADDSYIAANFDNAASGGNISNWLLSPTLALNNGYILTFYTRTEADSPFPDRLRVRLSTNGASTDIVNDFSTVLRTINPTLDLGGYPEGWTVQTIILSLPGATSGRLAFQYDVTDTSINGNYIGIDTFAVDDGATGAVPEPATAGFLLLGLVGMWSARKYSRAARMAKGAFNEN